MRQKDIFLATEGDAWFARNRDALAQRRLPDDDAVLRELIDLPEASSLRVLEVGCGDARRLAWLHQHGQAAAIGVEPSAQACAAARALGVDARQGTADRLPVEAASVDVIVFGFCLYLCDREDLPAIAREASRVLRTPGWIVIEDFYSPSPRERRYHHCDGVRTFKMDYRTLFLDQPGYVCVTQRVRHHATRRYTDDPDEWVAVSVLRRLPEPART